MPHLIRILILCRELGVIRCATHHKVQTISKIQLVVYYQCCVLIG